MTTAEGKTGHRGMPSASGAPGVRGTPSAPAASFTLAALLDPAMDPFLCRRLQDEPGFDPARLAAVAQAHATTAQRAFEQYREAGPIDPADLLQPDLPEAVRAQAVLLLRADEAARQASHEDALGGGTAGLAVRQAVDAIGLELARLHGSLQGMAGQATPAALQSAALLLGAAPVAPAVKGPA